jgi:hypothetical protein
VRLYGNARGELLDLPGRQFNRNCPIAVAPGPLVEDVLVARIAKRVVRIVSDPPSLIAMSNPKNALGKFIVAARIELHFELKCRQPCGSYPRHAEELIRFRGGLRDLQMCDAIAPPVADASVQTGLEAFADIPLQDASDSLLNRRSILDGRQSIVTPEPQILDDASFEREIVVGLVGCIAERASSLARFDVSRLRDRRLAI